MMLPREFYQNGLFEMTPQVMLRAFKSPQLITGEESESTREEVLFELVLCKKRGVNGANSDKEKYQSIFTATCCKLEEMRMG